jgi:iron complex transport system permease protein
MLTRRRFGLIVGGYALSAAVICLVAPFFGSERLSLSEVWNGLVLGRTTVDADIFFLQRLPRVVLAFLVGGALAATGGALQVVLRNALAEPFILGIAGSGALGAVVAISIPGLFLSAGPFSTVQVLSLAGCLASMAVIYRLATGPMGLSMNSVLLAGVTINVLCGAAVLLVRYLVNPQLLVIMDRWMMGGLDVVGFEETAALLPLLLPGLALLFRQAGALNHLAFGEEMAAGRGVDVSRVQKEIFIGAGLSTAAAVSLAGPIGFVGLILPHAVRRVSGVDYRLVLPASFLSGGSFLVLCDLLARTVVAPTEMPVGIVTAMIGGPVFFHILLKGRR